MLAGCGTSAGGGETDSDQGGQHSSAKSNAVFDGESEYGEGKPGSNGEPLCLTFGRAVVKVATERGHKGLVWKPLRGAVSHNPIDVPYPLKGGGTIPTNAWSCEGRLWPKGEPEPAPADDSSTYGFRVILNVVDDSDEPEDADLGEAGDPGCTANSDEGPPSRSDPTGYTVPSTADLKALNARLGDAQGGIRFCGFYTYFAAGPWLVQLITRGAHDEEDTDPLGVTSDDVGIKGGAAIVVDWLNAIGFEGKALK